MNPRLIKIPVITRRSPFIPGVGVRENIPWRVFDGFLSNIGNDIEVAVANIRQTIHVDIVQCIQKRSVRSVFPTIHGSILRERGAIIGHAVDRTIGMVGVGVLAW